MKPCPTEGCDGLIPDKSRTGVCHNCSATHARWNKRRPAEVLERRRKLTMYGARINVVLDNKDIGDSKVISFYNAVKKKAVRHGDR